jgi:hypothetical protein
VSRTFHDRHDDWSNEPTTEIPREPALQLMQTDPLQVLPYARAVRPMAMADTSVTREIPAYTPAEEWSDDSLSRLLLDLGVTSC